ncbi:40S ribosomal protein S7-like [Iris pallida]|uniref:40S ribosomal protein S7 n=1 Tax=Iris pallida TaxID=29817 RepID=A0AAX6EIU9_IRIPA|nr:40S ribosomal protein S7-like [Iris pallida]
MFTASRKIQKDKGLEPTEFEDSVAQSFFDLENTNQELKSDLKDLYINSAIQIDVAGNKKAVVIHVPFRLRKGFRKIHVRLVRELEKKFSGKDVILIATPEDFEATKEGFSCSPSSQPYANCCSRSHFGRCCLPCRDCWKACKISFGWLQDHQDFLGPEGAQQH